MLPLKLKAAIAHLSKEEPVELFQWLGSFGEPRGTHSVLDIPAFSVGKVLRPLSPEDDILGEMLEDRF